MMQLLRNREVRLALILQLVISAVISAAGFLYSTYLGVLALGACAAFVAIYLISTHLRYQKLADLAQGVNKVLHGSAFDVPDGCREGELSILCSEIDKMTVRLTEQQQTLTQDKVFLANSLADISHQIRTPLTAMNLLIQRLSDASLPESDKRQLVREMYGLSARIDWLIEALLKISKLDAGTVKLKSENIPLEELVKNACAPLLVAMELREIRLETQISGNFHGDAAWTSEAIENIIKNCVEHTPKGGKITVTAQENALYSQIEIRDTGSGIAPEDLPHIFERFYKGRNSQNGFGIGLALARTIITNQSGFVKAENLRNGGAAFTLRFNKATI